MSPCLGDLARDPARAGLLSSEERQALLAQVVAFSSPSVLPPAATGS
jgi:hypothetical protein